jgi:amidophosphoribosyltransferase
MGAGPRDPVTPQFTDHYFTGDYPTRLLDRETAQGGDNPSTQPQLSFLEDA